MQDSAQTLPGVLFCWAVLLLVSRTTSSSAGVDGMGTHCHVGHVDGEVESEECARLG